MSFQQEMAAVENVHLQALELVEPTITSRVNGALAVAPLQARTSPCGCEATLTVVTTGLDTWRATACRLS